MNRSVNPCRAKTSASPIVATVSPAAPWSSWRRATSADLWVLACGRSAIPRSRSRAAVEARFASMMSRSSSSAGVSSSATVTASPSITAAAAGGSNVEAEGAKLLAAVLGDLVRAPRREPHPVDAEVGHQALQRGRGLVLDDVGERARGTGERHVDRGHAVPAERDAVDQAKIDHVDAKLGVDHVAERLKDVLGLRGAARRLRRRRWRGGLRGFFARLHVFAHL